MMQAHRSKQRVQHERGVFVILVVMLLDQETPRKTAPPPPTGAVFDPKRMWVASCTKGGGGKRADF
jgi:hypothetical protein